VSVSSFRFLPFARARVTAFAVALCSLGLALAALAPAPAHATAYGIQYFGTFNVGGWTVPSGQLAHLIEGSGLRVNTDGANFAVAGNLCDTSMRFTYGNGARHIDGNVHWGCSAVGQWKYAINQTMPRGDACAELWMKNWRARVARQCHYVH
jgi:hypothetical protein